MKTPIQKLIDKLNSLAGFIGEADTTEDKYYRDGLREAIEEAELLLKEEKRVINTAYLDGIKDESGRPNVHEDLENCVVYYDETFNTKEK